MGNVGSVELFVQEQLHTERGGPGRILQQKLSSVVQIMCAKGGLGPVNLFAHHVQMQAILLSQTPSNTRGTSRTEEIPGNVQKEGETSLSMCTRHCSERSARRDTHQPPITTPAKGRAVKYTLLLN
jgi:hypothetical protein